MPITLKQKELRKKHLGSSDIAAILGVDRFRNSYDIWLDKTGKLEEQEENQAMYAGTMFENGVLKFAADKLGTLLPNQYRSVKDQGIPIGSNVDAIARDTGNPVEAKTAGLYGPLFEEWGDDGTDQVPDRVIVQAETHMICTDKPVCHVAVFIGGRGFRLYEVPQDQAVKDTIIERAIDFWDNHVVKDIPPEDAIPSLAVIKRIRREPEVVVDISDALVEKWLEAKEAESQAKKARDEAQAELLAALGTAEAGNYNGGMITYFSQSRKGFDTKTLKAEMPEVAEKYKTKTTYRVLRQKKAKK